MSTYLHATLTTDDLSRPFFHADRSLLKVLLKKAAQAVRELVDELYPVVRSGLVYSVHTFGRDLGFKPHVHLVMTKGGLKDDAWVEIDHLPAAKAPSPRPRGRHSQETRARSDSLLHGTPPRLGLRAFYAENYLIQYSTKHWEVKSPALARLPD